MKKLSKLFKFLLIPTIVVVVFLCNTATLQAEKMKPINMQQFWNLKKPKVEKKIEPKKRKDQLQLDRAALKKKVVTRKNGDIFAPDIPVAKDLSPNMPRHMDALIAYYFPWVSIPEVDAMLEKTHKDRTILRSVKNDLKAVNTALAGSACRFTNINPSLGTIKSKIENGVVLFWVCNNNDNFFMFANNRQTNRAAFTDMSKWRKELAKQTFPVQQIDPLNRNPQYFLVVGVNMESGEVAVTPTNERASAIFITIAEMKRIHNTLLEPSW